MVLAIAHQHRALLDDYVVCSHVEDYTDLSPFLQNKIKSFEENTYNKPKILIPNAILEI